MDIDKTLAEREKRYGDFHEHARITQNIKRAMRDSPNWEKLSDDKKEALEMDAHKIGRILNGDPDYHDSWHDRVGYAKLVADSLNKTDLDIKKFYPDFKDILKDACNILSAIETKSDDDELSLHIIHRLNIMMYEKDKQIESIRYEYEDFKKSVRALLDEIENGDSDTALVLDQVEGFLNR